MSFVVDLKPERAVVSVSCRMRPSFSKRTMTFAGASDANLLLSALSFHVPLKSGRIWAPTAPANATTRTKVTVAILYFIPRSFETRVASICGRQHIGAHAKWCGKPCASIVNRSAEIQLPRDRFLILPPRRSTFPVRWVESAPAFPVPKYAPTQTRSAFPADLPDPAQMARLRCSKRTQSDR